jgi:metal-responsive CopG/Arc/MetJ family transcriptional regulator
MRKVTISLPDELIEFADQRAQATGSNRSQIIGWALREIKNRTQAQLAAEGYQFYAQEAREFAEASSAVVAAAWGEWETEVAHAGAAG